MHQMTVEERNKNCWCYSLCEDSNENCDVCEEYFDQRCEEHEEARQKRMFEAEEY